MSEERYVAAIEISSSKIIGAVGIPQAQGQLKIVAIEHEKCQNCVRLGMIQNVDETADHISRVISKLEKKSALEGKKITGVFIGIAGRSMRNIEKKVTKRLPDDSIITQEILRDMEREAAQIPLDNSLDIVDVVPRNYVVGGIETMTPAGEVGNAISAVYDVIVVRQGMKKNISRTLEKLGGNLKNEGFVVSALATAKLVLSEDEKRLGCMLVDMGAETTTVSIYKDGGLCYYATLPLGSRNITRDITSLSVLEDAAEEIKTTTGTAIAPESPSTLNYSGIKISDVINIVVARSNEIVANVMVQPDYAGLHNSDLPAGIILVGGGSKLKNMPELIHHQSGLKVRRAQLPSYVSIEQAKIPQAETIEVASILYAGASQTDINCLQYRRNEQLGINGEPNPDEQQYEEDKEREIKPEPPKEPTGFQRWMKRTQEKIARAFTPQDEDENDNELLDD